MHASAQRIVWRRPACPHFVSCKNCGTRQQLCSGHVRAKTLPGLWPLSLKSRNGNNTCHKSRQEHAPKASKPLNSLHWSEFYDLRSKSKVHPGKVCKCLADGLEVPLPGRTAVKTPTFLRICWYQIDLLCKLNWLQQNLQQSHASYTSKGARVPSAWEVCQLWDDFCSTSLVSVSISRWQIPDDAGNPIAEWSRWRLK